MSLQTGWIFVIKLGEVTCYLILGFSYVAFMSWMLNRRTSSFGSSSTKVSNHGSSLAWKFP